MRHLLGGYRPSLWLALGVIALVVASAGSASARPLITGAQIKNGSLTGADIKNGSLSGADIRSGAIALSDISLSARASLRGARGPAGVPGKAGPLAAGPPGPEGPPGPPANAGFSSEVWGVIDRNSYGSPVAQGRVGPLGRSSGAAFAADVPTPFGTGSLSVLVDTDPGGGGNQEKISYGNESNFAGLKLADVVKLKLWVYATGENEQPAAAVISPGITLEVDPDTTTTAGSNFSSLVYVPPAPTATSTWLQNDATVGSHWFATGATGTASGCNQTTFCTLAELKTALPNAAVTYSVAISKGRDSSFLGAVDGLQINGFTYDFEALGVRKIATP
jgi:hypothetical protein